MLIRTATTGVTLLAGLGMLGLGAAQAAVITGTACDDPLINASGDTYSITVDCGTFADLVAGNDGAGSVTIGSIAYRPHVNRFDSGAMRPKTCETHLNPLASPA